MAQIVSAVYCDTLDHILEFNQCMYVQVCVSKRLSCHAGCQEVISFLHQRRTCGIYCMQATKQRDQLWKSSAGITRSPKQKYHLSHKKNLCPPKFILKKGWYSSLYKTMPHFQLMQRGLIGPWECASDGELLIGWYLRVLAWLRAD